MHSVEVNNMNQPTWNVNQPISRSDSVKSSKSEKSVTSPPPKKQEKRILAEEIPLPEDSDEDLRLLRIEAVQL